MGKYKIDCDNILCLYHQTNNNCELKTVKLSHGKCQCFRASLNYYIIQFLDAFCGNFIPDYNWTDDVRIGGYFAMHIYNLDFSTNVHGSWGMLQFFDKNDVETEGYKKALREEEIRQREPDVNKYIYFYEKLVRGELPPYYEDEIEQMNKERAEKEAKEKEAEEKVKNIPDDDNYGKYGLLGPDGKFYPCEFGDHTKLAYDIVNKYWKQEFREWRNGKCDGSTALDFIQIVKHFILIHNTSGGIPFVSYHPEVPKKLTKKQKDFLYNYFMKINRIFYAEQFISED